MAHRRRDVTSQPMDVDVAPGAPAGPPTRIWYVATDGSDRWSGGLPSPRADGSDGPLATLERARDAIRTARATGFQGPASVVLRGGRYILDETLVLSLEDGASSECDGVSYTAYPDEVPVITSLVEIRGWRELEDWSLPIPVEAKEHVWVADLPAELERFFVLYEGGRRLPRARAAGFAPTEPYLLPEQLWAMTGSVVGHRHDLLTTLRFPPGALRAWSNLEDVEIVIRPNYPFTMNILGLASVDETTGVATTTLPGTYPLRPLYNRFSAHGDVTRSVWAENVLEGLDRPGAWVVDTRERRVYLWPLDDEPGVVEVPRLRELVRIEGAIDVDGPVDRPVRGITFEGITFTGGDRDLWTADDGGVESDFEMVDKDNALLRFRGAEACVVRDCRFVRSGGTGLRLDLHCQDILVERNEFSKLGGSGIAVIGYGPGTKDVNRRNLIIDNDVSRCGEIYWHAIGLVIANSGENVVRNNHFHHLPRGAIGVYDARPHFFDPAVADRRECARMIRRREVGEARTWDEVLPFLHSRDNLIECNEIDHTNGFGGDSTCIDISGAGEGNVVRRNHIHDVLNPNIHGALRADDFQNGVTFEENVVHRTNSGGLMMRLRNAWLNNVVVDVDPSNYVWLGQQPLAGTVIRGNLFVHPGHEAPGLGIMWRPAGMDPFERLTEAEQVGPDIFFSTGSDGGLETLRRLQANGLETETVSVDPEFEDLAGGDLRLTRDSPARDLGIRSIDLSDVGLTPDFRATMAARRERRD